jgi:hypothetical protein
MVDRPSKLATLIEMLWKECLSGNGNLEVRKKKWRREKESSFAQFTPTKLLS